MSKVLGLCGYGLEVPDLDVAERFYTTFGLSAERKDGLLLLRSPGRPNDEIVVSTAAQKKMHHLSFFIEPGSEHAFGEKLRAAGLEVSDKAPAGGGRTGLWFRDPWDTLINLHAMHPAPVPVVAMPRSNYGGRAERVDLHLWKELGRNTPPSRIGHMLMFTQDWERAEKFFADVLGFRTTDRAVGTVAFMAVGDGVTDHHGFGLINGTHRGFQHSSFQVPSIDDIGFGAWRMNKAGYKESFGPGRHAHASNLFHYTRDPWGSWVEYYADMDKISDAWTCRDWNELPYAWGPEWSPEFWGKEMNGNFEPR